MSQEDGNDSFVVTPLNFLGKQNVKILKEAGLPAVAVSKETANQNTFKVSYFNDNQYSMFKFSKKKLTFDTQDIENAKYRVVVINPEILMGSDDVDTLWKKPKVTKRILSFIFDEVHCISQWNKFRKEYLRVGNVVTICDNL
jgi:superfamily II DNA helicase RecQ